MTQIKLSYEEKIINALMHVKHKRGATTLENTQADFNAIHEVLKPLHDEIAKYDKELKLQVSRQIALAYAAHLNDKLASVKETDLPPIEASRIHLRGMIKRMQDDAYTQKMSCTKLHRWVGYIQGVMVARGWTTVEQEKADYKVIKVQTIECIDNLHRNVL